MCWMPSLVDRGKVTANRANFRITNLRVEYLGQNLELTLTGQLLVVKVIWIRDDGTTASSFNLVLYQPASETN